MAANRLKPPKSIKIDFHPSPKQYELWKMLQPNFCPVCGGEIEQVLIGVDQHNNPQYKPQCIRCHCANIPQLILGGGAAGKQYDSASLYGNVQKTTSLIAGNSDRVMTKTISSQ